MNGPAYLAAMIVYSERVTGQGPIKAHTLGDVVKAQRTQRRNYNVAYQREYRARNQEKINAANRGRDRANADKRLKGGSECQWTSVPTKN